MMPTNVSPMGYAPRFNQFCWVTWLSPYLSGDRHCLTFLHQKVNCQTPKSSADFSNWIEEHSRLVNLAVAQYQRQGGTVTVEDENSFKVTSKTGICLSGKCDVVVGEDRQGAGAGLVIDIKTGAKKPKDRTQVMLYMALLPSIPDIPHITHTPLGLVQYKDGSTHEILPEEITPEFKNQVHSLLSLAAGPTPEATPSFHECRFCDLKDDCPSAKITEQEVANVDWL